MSYPTTGLISNTSSQWIIWISHERGRRNEDTETKQVLQVYVWSLYVKVKGWSCWSYIQCSRRPAKRGNVKPHANICQSLVNYQVSLQPPREDSVVFGCQGERKKTLTSVAVLTHYLMPHKKGKRALSLHKCYFLAWSWWQPIASPTSPSWVKLVLSSEKEKWASPFYLLGTGGGKRSKINSKSKIILLLQEPHTLSKSTF